MFFFLSFFFSGYEVEVECCVFDWREKKEAEVYNINEIHQLQIVSSAQEVHFIYEGWQG